MSKINGLKTLFLVFGCLGSVFLLLVMTCGCATSPLNKKQPGEISEAEQLLSQAVTQFQEPDAPKFLVVLDQAQVDWNHDKSMKITVHRIWAASAKPDAALPPLATLNQNSQTLAVQTLNLYDLNKDGTFSRVSSPVSLEWTTPEPNLPEGLSKIVTVHLPVLAAHQALEVAYTLETKISSLMSERDFKKDFKKPHPVAAEGSFAFCWNDYTPSLKRDLTVKMPSDLSLYAVRLRMPQNLLVSEEKHSKEKTVHFSMDDPADPIPVESYQPALQDLAPLAAFTVNKSWESSLSTYRKRVKMYLDAEPGPVYDLLGDAGGNTTLPLADRLSKLKEAIHQKVEWVDTGLPVYLNPDRPVSEIIDSGKGTSHDLAMLFVMALKAIKLNPQVYLYRQSTSGDLLGDLPALSQFDGILVAVSSGKDLIWLDPTEPLAAPRFLPLSSLGRQALSVFTPLTWKTLPPFTAREHRKHRDLTMSFDASGKLKCTVDMRAYGSSELALRRFFRATTGDNRRQAVLKSLSKRFPGVRLLDYHFGDYRDLSTPLDVHYTFEIPRYSKFAADGGMTFYPLVFEDIDDFFATLKESRQTPVVIPQNFNSETQAIVKLPGGYKTGDLPKAVMTTNQVAEFSADSKVQFDTLVYERYLGLKQRTILPGNEYKDLLEFYQTVLKQDRTPFIAEKAK